MLFHLFLFLGSSIGLALFQKPVLCYASMLAREINVLPPLRNKMKKTCKNQT